MKEIIKSLFNIGSSNGREKLNNEVSVVLLDRRAQVNVISKEIEGLNTVKGSNNKQALKLTRIAEQKASFDSE